MLPPKFQLSNFFFFLIVKILNVRNTYMCIFNSILKIQICIYYYEKKIGFLLKFLIKTLIALLLYNHIMIIVIVVITL